MPEDPKLPEWREEMERLRHAQTRRLRWMLFVLGLLVALAAIIPHYLRICC
jgi:hypothetical protein